MEEDIFKYLHQ